RELICQCCGMPLTDELIGHNSNGTLNEDYCKWCYADGTYTYHDMDSLINVCVPHMVKSGFNEKEARSYMKNMLPNLKYWKNHDYLSDGGKFEAFKKELIDEINDLHIKGMPKVESLNALIGSYVNLEYPLPSGIKAKFLNDQITYLGTQLESDKFCYGVVANADYILVCTYEEEGKNPNLLLFKKR
nr:zinc ribbon domain-containing protein [Clostridia bacterium]